MDLDSNFELAQSACSTETDDSETLKLRADLIADARQKFPTREALEDSIRERQAEVELAANYRFGIDEETRARDEALAELATEELCSLLPMRYVLHTAADLSEMVEALREQKVDALQSFDMDKARNIQSEIDELEEQIHKEEHYLLVKELGQTECAGCGEKFLTEKRMVGILRTTETHCQECRSDDSGSNQSFTVNVENVEREAADIENKASNSDESNESVESAVPVDPFEKQPKVDLQDAPVACGFTSMFGW